MPRMIFTVTIDAHGSIPTNPSELLTPDFLEKNIGEALARVARNNPGHPPYTIKVSGGGPLTEIEQYRVWLRETLERAHEPR